VPCSDDEKGREGVPYQLPGVERVINPAVIDHQTPTDPHLAVSMDVPSEVPESGMSHENSHHNFRQFKDGGAIELRANDPNNTAMIDMIRKHLREINASFVKSDFSTPGFVHGHVPDGVAEMKRLSNRIRYQYEDVDNGGRIRMTSSDAKALVAIHDFMKFQVIEHRTSDPGAIEEDK